MQSAYIDLDQWPFRATATIGGGESVKFEGVFGAPLRVGFTFHRGGVVESIGDGATAKFVAKKEGARAGGALFLDSVVDQTEAASGLYQFSGVLNATELGTALGEYKFLDLACSVAWTPDGESEEIALDVVLRVWNSAVRLADTIPATADARWTWLKLAFPTAAGFAHNEGAKTIGLTGGLSFARVAGKKSVQVFESGASLGFLPLAKEAF